MEDLMLQSYISKSVYKTLQISENENKKKHY